MGTKCRCIVLPEGNSQAEMSEGNVGPGEAGHSQQSHQDMNFSCRDRVNSGCAKPNPFPSKTSCTYQDTVYSQEGLEEAFLALRADGLHYSPALSTGLGRFFYPDRSRMEHFISFPNMADLRASACFCQHLG